MDGTMLPRGDGFFVAAPGLRFAEADHVVPRARGGSDAIGNLVLSCGPCNNRKGAS
jgi:5-methylcytosine-specific restriction endonuclease McrA